VSWDSEDSERGLIFDFLRSPGKGSRVLTGHADGSITLNIDDADDSVRERIRNEMHEQYRTMLASPAHTRGVSFATVIAGSRRSRLWGLVTPSGRGYRALRAERVRCNRSASTLSYSFFSG
jgi:hypothetical protein